MKKAIKVPKNIDKDTERYLGALSEMHNENLKGIRENFIIMNKKFDTVNEKLDSHTEMIGDLMKDVTILKEDVSVIKKDLKKKVDYDEFLSLVKRVQQLEAKR